MKTNYNIKEFKNFEAKCVKHYAKIDEISNEIKVKKVDEWDEVEKLEAKKTEMKNDFENRNRISGTGFWKAYHMIRAFQYGETTTIEFRDFLWEHEVESFCEALEKFDVARFVMTNTSTALMENIHWLIAKGYKMDAIEIATENIWGKVESKFGLAFEK